LSLGCFVLDVTFGFRRTLPPVRRVLNPLGSLLAGLAIGYLLAPFLNRLMWRNGRKGMAVDLPPGSEAEKEWRVRVAGLDGPQGAL
jgi:hypothetical protein